MPGCRVALLLRLAPEDFVIAVAVERRINIAKINALTRDFIAQYVEVITVIEAVFAAFRKIKSKEQLAQMRK